MDRDNKNLIDNNERGFIQNETANTIPAGDSTETSNTDPRESHKNVSAEEGSKSDPQLTELDGLKKGGVEPHVHPGDKPRDPEKSE